MNADECRSKLNVELHQAIECVKSALNLTVNQKKSLRKKAVVAKNHIQDDVSFHLDLLRNREIWLLEQVEVHAQMKEETFESHLNELCILFAKLEVYQNLLTAPELMESHIILSQAEEVVARVNNDVMHSEEVSGVCFYGDNFALSDAVKNFGRIMEGELCEPPRKVHRASKNSPLMEAAFIREHFQCIKSSDQKDWLVDGIEVKEVKKHAGVVWEYFEELTKSDRKAWLYQENQNQVDLEMVSSCFSMHFQQVKATPAAEWLQSEAAPEVNENILWHTALDKSENIKTWLLRPFEDLSLSSNVDDDVLVDEELVDEGISLPRHCNVKQKSVNCERFSHNEKEKVYKDGDDQLSDDWLLTCSETSSPQVIQSGSWLQRFRDSTGETTSDWLIVAESEPDYCEWLTQDSINRCKSCPGETECSKVGAFSVFRNVLNGSQSEWLATATDW